jgi:hypothetical protein
MDVQHLIGEVARRHNVLVDPGDPIFVAVTLNELLVAEYVEAMELALARAEKAARAASREQVEQVRQAAAQLMNDSVKQLGEQERAAGSSLKFQLEQLVEGSVHSAQAAASESSQNRAASFWAAALATVCACLAAVAVGVACWRP